MIILQNDILNESKLKTVVVLPLTTNTIYAELPNNVFLEKSLTGLSKDSVTQPHLIVHVDKNRLLEKVSKLHEPLLSEILNGVVATIR